jgi:hypothetical protein
MNACDHTPQPLQECGNGSHCVHRRAERAIAQNEGTAGGEARR